MMCGFVPRILSDAWHGEAMHVSCMTASSAEATGSHALGCERQRSACFVGGVALMDACYSIL